MLKADCQIEVFDLMKLRSEDMRTFEVSCSFDMKDTTVLHGIAGWFEAHFIGTNCEVILSTSPWDTLTHWWQARLMLRQPIAVNRGARVDSIVKFLAVGSQTYEFELVMESGGIRREQRKLNLNDMDATAQDLVYSHVRVSDTLVVNAADWEATKAKPTSHCSLIGDPMASAKSAALAGEQQVAAALAATKAQSDPTGRRPIGTRIRVADRLFQLVDDQAPLDTGAVMLNVAALGTSMLMTRQDSPYSMLVQYVFGGEKPICCHWALVQQ
jgi:hypothetical protein